MDYQRNLRGPSLKALAALSVGASVCELVWQGDFGSGQATGSGVFSDPGANPCRIYGPIPTAGNTGNGILLPPFKVGMVINGDLGSEFVLAKLVLASATDLLPGQGYWLDKDFNATLLSTTNASNILNAEIGVLNVWGPQVAAGTYYVWLQRAGHCSIKADASSVASGFAETSSAVAGNMKFPASATAGQKSITPASAYVASSGVTFTGNTTNGSPFITGVTSIVDLQLGQVITGSNLPSNSIIAGIAKTGNTWTLTIGTNTAGSYSVNQNATGTATGTTFTVTSHVTANLYWPTLGKQN